ncbi:Hypothetical predicted protein [Mytilus galloprovincialis]|uniref:Integrase catalytic domain-containing protein n=1 Tax=Mytilus galloprovincialis TaxID=29158 RepID=A0A8B6DQ16_MYTGA|nr:Hypothetical predicted protein [Mytilus galloprovincialis]
MEKQIKGPLIVRLSAISNNCWFANVEIGGLDTNMLIDTGSAVTLISKENYDELKCDKSKLIKVTSTLATADGEPLTVLEETKLSITLGGGKTFINSVIVAELGGMPGILGLDFLSRNAFVIDTGKGRLCSPLVDVQLIREGSLDIRCARVHLAETVHIPAHCEMFVTGKIRGHFPSTKDGCLEPLDRFRGGEHVIIPKSLTDTTKTNIVFSIMNPTPNPKILKKNIQVATVHPVEQILSGQFGQKEKVSYGDRCGFEKRISSIRPEVSPDLPAHLQPLVDNSSKKLTPDQRAALTTVIKKYSDIFMEPDGILGQTNLFEHTIDTGDAKPIKLPPRRLPIHMREIAETEIEKMLEQDIIEHSTCPVSVISKHDKTPSNSNQTKHGSDDSDVSTSVDFQESNWTQQWSTTELKQYQHEDKTISSMLSLRQIHGKEKPHISTSDQDLSTLLKQWELLDVIDDILYRRWENSDGTSYQQLVAPKRIRGEILRLLHDCRTAGHFGRDRTLAKVRARFYWPGMTTDITRWCQTCLLCQQRKPGPGLGKSPMQHRNVYRPMECIAIDLMGPLPITDHSNQYIMVVSDYFTKWTEAYPLKEHCAQTVADKLVTEFISRFGAPCRIHTDQGREFESKLFASMCDLLEIEKTRTTPYHPQSDGMVERYNRTLQQILSMFVNENKDDWDSHLPYVTMAYRACTHESTKCSPNLLMLGREISLPIDILTGSNQDEISSFCPNLYIEWMRDAMQRAFDKVHENLQSSFHRQKKYYDCKLKHRQFEIGNKVLRWYPPKANKKLGIGLDWSLQN